ncbi:DUF58 domain-containing protein [Candidatus Babeliales bacterium]|nr:DUF58 domain-containing protein [Candidatus Babeliales bacterium]
MVNKQDEIREKIKRIKIFTKRLVSSSLSGDYLSAFKGSGMEFHQLRDYQVGDDVRLIDWNSSVKSKNLKIKEFIEERDRTIILMIDISKSNNYASNLELKRELLANIASSLALIADENNDRVGAAFFSDSIEKWFPPKRGIAHIHNILKAILTLTPSGNGTNISEALKFLIRLKQQNSIVFMLSDFIDDDTSYSKFLKLISYKYDFIGMRILDAFESEFPDLGLLEVEDPETGEQIVLDTKNLKKFLNDRIVRVNQLFSKYRIDLLDLKTNQNFINPLIRFFHRRIRRSI